MRAAVLRAIGRPLEVLDLEVEAPRAGEVLVRMTASGVCHSDVHRADGDWGPIPGALVLGHEGAGVIEALGPGVTDRAVGQAVALSWNASCATCAACARGEEWLCEETKALDCLLPDGTTRLRTADGAPIRQYIGIGTFGEYAVVPVAAAIPVGPVAPEVAALIGCCVATGVGAVRNAARVEPGERVAVLGLGGVGLSVVMGAALAGAGEVVAIDRDPAKLDLAREVGATRAVEALGHEPDGTLDVAFEAAGATRTAELALASVRPGGRVVLVGMPHRDARVELSPLALVERSITLVGTNYGWTLPARDFPFLAEQALAGRLPVERLVDRRIGLDDVNAAMDELRAGRGLRRVIAFPG
ncbi:MAG: alcohol dehydrogenase catalytic domain-containing protein [Actinomycetota bacterium]